VALAVAYPTVWIVAGAQARYFMPLYPLIAVLVGLVIERCSVAAMGHYPRRAWRQFLLCSSTLIAVLSIVTFIPAKWALGSYQPQWFRLTIVLIAAAAVWTLWKCYRANAPGTRLAAVAAIAIFAGLAQAGALMNFNIARWNDPSAAVAEIKDIVSSTPLVSLTAIDHRFAYFYEAPIAELAWPRDATKLAVGLVALLLITGCLLQLYALWAAMPGKHATPFFWTMTAGAWQLWISFSVVYLGAFLSGVRPGRWFGSRLLPLAASSAIAFIAALVPWWWLGWAIALVASAALLIVISYYVEQRDY